uniref:Transmembrane protein n=1 Tax=Fagus sylvatica TaxID=28930 RepID=A0A2N9I1B2_FAGSY
MLSLSQLSPSRSGGGYGRLGLWWRWASIGSELCIYRFVGGCGFVGAVALGGLVLMVVDCWCGDSQWVGLLWICWCSGPLVFWVVGRRLWVVICVLSVSFPVGMVGCEDVCEISGECDLLLGLDCGGGWVYGGQGRVGGEGCSGY